MEIDEIIKKLSDEDPTLDCVMLRNTNASDSQLLSLMDCMILHPNIGKGAIINDGQLKDQIGCKLAQYVAISTTVEGLFIDGNHFTEETYLAVASALYVNSSLAGLCMANNQPVDKVRVDTAFIHALRINPIRPTIQLWGLYTFDFDQDRLKTTAEKMAPPSMLDFVLCVHNKF